MWRGDSKELFYISGSQLMAVDVKTDGAAFESGIPKVLFETRPVSAARRNRYVVTTNGQRFLINTLVEDSATSAFTVVVNWMAEVKR